MSPFLYVYAYNAYENVSIDSVCMKMCLCIYKFMFIMIWKLSTCIHIYMCFRICMCIYHLLRHYMTVAKSTYSESGLPEFKP